MNRLFQDLRIAARWMRRQPAFTLLVIGTLAVGIGANTALFSVIHGVLLAPLPYKDSDRLVMLWEKNPSKNISKRPVAYARYRAWAEQSRSFDEFTAYQQYWATNISSGGRTVRVSAIPVLPNFFSFLGISPEQGRSFLPEETELGNDAVALLSHQIWQRHYGGDREVTGKTLNPDGTGRRIVGVMPPDVQVGSLLPMGFDERTDSVFWLPLSGVVWEARVYGALWVLARLEPGVSLEQAQAEMTAIAGRLAVEYPDTDIGWDVEVVPLRTQMLGEMETGLLLLWGAVGLVLLVACANVAGLLLARATTRQKEMAVRAALGAGRLRLIRQMLAESLLLALLGGAAGVLLAYWSTDALLALSPTGLPRMENVAINPTVLVAVLGLSLLTGALFGLPPALKASKLNVQEALNQGGTRSGSAQGRWSLHGALVVFEVALAFVLVVGSGLLIKSFIRLWGVPPGFNPKNVLNLRVDLARSKYPDSQARVTFLNDLLPRLEALPGVESVGVINQAPLGGFGDTFRLWFPGQRYDRSVDIPTADVRVANLAYFRTMGIDLLHGRLYEEDVAPGDAGEALINQTMARQFWPVEDALGKRFSLQGPEAVQHTIVGVVADVRHFGLDQPAKPEFYLPYPIIAWPSVGLMLRTATDPLPLVEPIRTTVWALDPEMVPYDIETMEQRLADTLAGRQFSMTLLGLFAGTALALAALGLYGVLAYSVTQRTREIGIRMALGARPGNIFKLILRQGMTLTLLGVAIGMAAAWALSRLLSSLLFEISPTDATTFTAVPLLLLGVALLACYLPARHATHVDPMEALRAE